MDDVVTSVEAMREFVSATNNSGLVILGGQDMDGVKGGSVTTSFIREVHLILGK